MSLDAEEREAWELAISEAQEQATKAKAEVDNLVIDARRAGVSWLTIAAGLGVTRQSATERFSQFPELVLADEVARR